MRMSTVQGVSGGRNRMKWGMTALAAASLWGLRSTWAGDWPQWRGPSRTGISEEQGWSAKWSAPGPKKVWTASVGIGFGTVSVSQGRLYVLGNKADNDTVYGLDAKTGAEVWKHSYPCLAKDPNNYPGPRSTPTVEGGLVYTVSRQGHLFCLDAANGNVKWSKEFGKDFGGKTPTWGYATSPLVDGKFVIVEPGGEGTSVVALDKTTGELAWKNGSDPVAYSSPVAFDAKGQRCLAVFSASALVGRNAADGSELWRFAWKTSWDVNAATPIVADGKVFVSSGYNKGCVLVDIGKSPAEGVWTNKNMRNHCNSCVLWQGFLYGFDEKELKCVDWKSGEVKWSEKKYGKGSLMVADGKLILFSDRGALGVAQASPEGYKELAFAPVLEVKAKEGYPANTQLDTWAAPVLANGSIYCRSHDDLVCLEVRGQ